MSGRRLFGVETEYAVTAVDERGAVLPRDEVGAALVRAAATMLPSLPGSCGSGLFLGNGSRLYVDAGAHPELAGPECLNPYDIVRYLRAGDRLLQRLADDIQRRNPIVAETRLFAGNVDYSGSGATWGSHESYCHRIDPAVLRRRLVPHLVTRVIFCGAGGFNPCSHGLEFTLSPRAHYLNHVVSDESTHDRGITHTRNEPLSAHGYHRQHLICGESLRSDLSAWLRVGTTALVVAMIDGGVTCGDEVDLRSPVDALRTMAGDPTCSQRVPTRRGSSLTAIEVQRHYLEQARSRLRESFMPSWAGEVCERWGEILDRLAAGPDAVSATVDWAIKFAIYRDRARRRDLDWESLRVWSQALDAIERARRVGDGPFPALTGTLLRTDNRLRAEAEAFAPVLREVGCGWEQLDAVLSLRRELFEADTRWGQLGPKGVFEQLDRAGILQHHVAGVDRIDEAVEQPPGEGRARVRGAVIHLLWRKPGPHSCGWDHVWDHKSNGSLDLSDPFVETEQWRAPTVNRASASPAAAAAAAPPVANDASMLEEISRLLSRVRPHTARRTRA